MKFEQMTVLLAAAVLCAAVVGCGAAAPAASGGAAQSKASPSEALGAQGSAAGAGGTPGTIAGVADSKGICVPIGETAHADLDGDGTEEEIFYEIKQKGADTQITSFTVNRVEYVSDLDDMSAWFISPDTGCYYITDLDKTDQQHEIALMDLGPSDDPVTYFFRYDGKKLKCMGCTSDLIKNDSYRLDGAGGIRAGARLDILQTWGAEFGWVVSGDKIVSAPDAWYTPAYVEGVTPPVTLVKTVDVYEKPDSKALKKQWQPGAGEVRFPSTDNKAWVEIRRGDEHGWLHVTEFYKVDCGGIPVNADELFNGLWYAD